MGCFGEIIEPSSRALWNDYEDENEDFVELSWMKNILPKDVELLLFMEGPLAVEFVNSCVNKSERLDEIPRENVVLYQIPNTHIFVCTSFNDDDSKFGEITLCLRPWLESAGNVICIQSLSVTKYHNLYFTSSSCIIRSLQTTCSTDKNENILEQPNILSGLTAGVLSLRDHLNLPGTAYAIYDDTPIHGIDSINSQPFYDLFNQLKIPVASEITRKVSVTSNLYT